MSDPGGKEHSHARRAAAEAGQQRSRWETLSLTMDPLAAQGPPRQALGNEPARTLPKERTAAAPPRTAGRWYKNRSI